jgi:hypothetical protein
LWREAILSLLISKQPVPSSQSGPMKLYRDEVLPELRR